MSSLHRMLAASHRLDRQERPPVTVRLQAEGVTIMTTDAVTRHVEAAGDALPDDATPAFVRTGRLP